MSWPSNKLCFFDNDVFSCKYGQRVKRHRIPHESLPFPVRLRVDIHLDGKLHLSDNNILVDRLLDRDETVPCNDQDQLEVIQRTATANESNDKTDGQTEKISKLLSHLNSLQDYEQQHLHIEDDELNKEDEELDIHQQSLLHLHDVNTNISSKTEIRDFNEWITEPAIKTNK